MRCGLLSVTILLVLPAVVWGQKTPTEELATLRPTPGIEVKLFASEPMITNPSCIDVDSHGRVWVAEIQFYRSKAKNPPADKIKVLEDTDGDGVADKVTVFADGLMAPMSICVCGNKVYSLISGEFCVFTDADGDLKADGPPVKILKGFSNANHDHTAHSIVIGPDHKWYMAHGDTGFNVTGTDGSKIESKWGAMVRGELDGSKLEIYAHNFRNPYEICVDSFGNAYCTDNDNDGNQSTRATWLLEGGNYGWYGGPPIKKQDLDQMVPPGTPYREHWHFRGYIPGNVPATVQTGFGSPCGICFYEGDLFGETFRNMPLHCDPGPREVRKYPHELAGFGMKGKMEAWLTTQGDNYFRPDDICVAPDGSLLISDWYDGGVGGHGYNDPDRGRIFRVTPTGKKPTSPTKGGPYKTLGEAAVALESPNLATQFMARERILNGPEKNDDKLDSLIRDPQHVEQAIYTARVLWLSARLGKEGHQIVLDGLGSPGSKSNPSNMRALCARILRRDPELLSKLLPFANDPSPEIQREVLLACRNVKKDDKLAPEVLKTILAVASKSDGKDRYMLETINIAAGEQKAELAKALIQSSYFNPAQFPLVQVLDPKLAGDLLAEKLGITKNTELALALVETAKLMPSVDAGRSLAAVIVNEKAAPDVRNAALKALGWNIAGPWAELEKDAKLRETVMNLLKKDQKAYLEGAMRLIASTNWVQATPALLALAGDADLGEEDRLRAIAVAVEMRGTELTEGLRKLVPGSTGLIRARLLATLVDLQDLKTIRAVLTDAKTSTEERNAMVTNALKTSGGALGLLKLLEAKSLPAATNQLILDQAVKHPDSNVRTLYEKYLPVEQRQKKLGDALRADDILKLTGDTQRGEKIFTQSNSAQCKNCHQVNGVGVNLGPDLSLIGKKYERAALLETIMFPSKAISHGYESYLLETTQGQTYLGFLVTDDEQQVVLKNAQSQLIRIAKSEVESLVKQDISIMPELVLKDVSAQDAADLLAYLSSLTQGTTAASSLRLLGPFSANQVGLDQAHPLEKLAANPDLKAEYKGLSKSMLTWEVVNSDGKLGFPGIDTVKYDKAKNQKEENVAHYALVYVDSLTEQAVQLLIGSDDSCKVWLNGKEIHRIETTRPLAFGQDQVAAKLVIGRNVVLIKVINNKTPGGVAFGVRSSEALTLKTE